MKSNKFKFGISYINTGSILHQLNGITKFILFMSWVTMVLITFDLRIICGLIVLGLALLKMSKVPFSVYKPLLIGTLVVLMMNALFMFLIAPNQGTDYMGSKTVLVPLFGHYDITAENSVGCVVKTNTSAIGNILKYFSVTVSK